MMTIVAQNASGRGVSWSSIIHFFPSVFPASVFPISLLGIVSTLANVGGHGVYSRD